MNANLITIIRASASLIRTSLQGRKRWISLAGYALLAVAAVGGFDLDGLARQLALDPNIEKDGTLIAIALAAGTTFRFFQSLGRNRKVDEEIADARERMDRNGVL